MKVLNEVYEKHLLRRGLLKEDKMIKVTQIITSTNSKKNISFREHTNNLTSKDAMLALPNKAAEVGFKENMKLSQDASAVSHPVKSLFAKLQKMFKIIFSHHIPNDNVDFEASLYTLA